MNKDKCLSCGKTEVELFPVFEDFFYCEECANKYNVDIPKKDTTLYDQSWGLFQ